MKSYPNLKVKTVLITGCSSGIGRASAEALKQRGWQVIPTARKDADLQTLRENGFQPVKLDLANEESVAKAYKQALDIAGNKLGALVNNAGYGQPGALEDLSRAEMRRQFEVNVIGTQHLTNLCIPSFRSQGYGRIVNVSSMLGRITMPFIGAYCASKYALESISDALRVELRDSGVAVSLIEPGPIDTNFSENAHASLMQIKAASSPFAPHYATQGERMRKRSSGHSPGMHAPRAAAFKVVKALESRHPNSRYKVTIPAYLGAAIRRFAPDWLVDIAFMKIWEKRTDHETHFQT